MIIPIRNSNILNGIFKYNVTLHQCVAKELSICSHKQQMNNLQFYKSNIGNFKSTPFVHCIRKIWNIGKNSQLRSYAKCSIKPTEKEDLKNSTENGKNQDDEQTPDSDHGRGRTLPRLMDFPEVMWPSMLNTIKNWIMIQFIIRPYMDREFNVGDFCQGAKKAMQVVSSKLMNGDFINLNNLVTSEAVNELKPVVQKLTVSQRRQLEVRETDIYLAFPYQVGIIFDETNEKVQKRWVEITMIFHVLRGLKEMRESGEDIPWNMGILPEYQNKVFICNYRFIKEFTNGQESDWIVNVVNHFKPIDLLNELKKDY